MIDNEIMKCYDDVIKIDHRILESDHTVIMFDIHLVGTSEHILECEKQVHKFMLDHVPDDRQELFSLTYSVYEQY